ncbi:MAG: recombinase family protein [Clostridia bacterium]|nr:recombinase family protein [Clostridia bacterium]
MKSIVQNITEQISRLKVAIYIRVSTHWQIDKDSLQVQKRELIAYAEMVLGIKEFEIFEDAGYSAKNTDRPDYQRMMGRLRTGEFSHLLVWKIDRISRNLLDFASMYNELKDLGITFVSKNEQFDTSSAIGEAMLKIILVFAELERNMTSERVSAVMLSRANNGQWNGGRIPYGYDYDKEEKVFSSSQQEAPIVRQIFNMYEEEQSVLHIARYLNEKCIKTRSGKAWSATGVHKILTNKFYIGTYIYNVHSDGRATKQRAEDEWIQIPFHHEAIISIEQFDRVQFALKRNKRGGNERGERHTSKHIHTFAGLLKCGVCDSNMSATLDRRRASGWRPSIYACSRRRNEADACDNKYVSDATIGPFIINYVANIIRARETIGKSTTMDMLERRLLKGEAFSSVASVEREGIAALYELLKSGSTGLEYKPKSIFTDDGSGDEIEYLQEQHRKTEIALNRMKSLYLFDESGISESEYIIERQKLIEQMENLEKRISVLQTPDNNETYSEEFEAKASYFVMVERLLSGQYIDYAKYIKGIDPKVPRSFFQQIINKIYITDGRVSSIEFANGMTHKFSYK